MTIEIYSNKCSNSNPRSDVHLLVFLRIKKEDENCKTTSLYYKASYRSIIPSVI